MINNSSLLFSCFCYLEQLSTLPFAAAPWSLCELWFEGEDIGGCWSPGNLDKPSHSFYETRRTPNCWVSYTSHYNMKSHLVVHLRTCSEKNHGIFISVIAFSSAPFIPEDPKMHCWQNTLEDFYLFLKSSCSWVSFSPYPINFSPFSTFLLTCWDCSLLNK